LDESNLVVKESSSKHFMSLEGKTWENKIAEIKPKLKSK
jgi:hypothetical protein